MEFHWVVNSIFLLFKLSFLKAGFYFTFRAPSTFRHLHSYALYSMLIGTKMISCSIIWINSSSELNAAEQQTHKNNFSSTPTSVVFLNCFRSLQPTSVLHSGPQCELLWMHGHPKSHRLRVRHRHTDMNTWSLTSCMDMLLLFEKL